MSGYDAWHDYAIAWLLSLLAGSAIVTARVGQWLYGRKAVDEPDDPLLFRHWKRRRLWIVISEFSALPAFCCIAVSATIYWGISPFFAIPISMFLAIIGFLLLVDGVQHEFRKRLGLPEIDA